MEPDQNIPNQDIQQPVSFPTVGAPQKSGGPKTLLIIGILILVGILGFVIYKSANKENDNVSEQPTPFDNLITNDTTQVATPSPTPIATASSANKAAVSIEVQNGTGITGEAAYLQTQLKNLGYSNVKVGNATSQDATATIVTFASSVSADIVAEITQKLNTIYQTVTTKTATTATTNVVIVTGLRKGATVKPSATPTATSSATPKASTSPSASPTATP